MSADMDEDINSVTCNKMLGQTSDGQAPSMKEDSVESRSKSVSSEGVPESQDIELSASQEIMECKNIDNGNYTEASSMKEDSVESKRKSVSLEGVTESQNTELSASQEIMERKNIDNGNNTEELKQDMEYLNNKLPYEILLLIFSSLLIDDLVTVQRVCHLWRAVAQDKSLWKDYELNIYTMNEFFMLKNERDVRVMPALRNINGHAENTFLDVILENVNELRKLNIDFVPPITSSQVDSVLGKYPNIEIICLDLCAPDILKSMEILKTSRYIKEVIFDNNHCQRSYDCCLPSKLVNLFNVFTDSSNFVALTEIDLRFLPLENAFKDKEFRKVLADIITLRSQKLLSLNLALFYSESANILNAVSECTKLEKLDLRLFNICPTDINIVGMSALKSLHLRLQNSHYPSTLCEYFNRGCWSYLTEVTFIVESDDKFRGGVLRAIIENIKQLKELIYQDSSRNTSESELDKVGTLTNLVRCRVTGFQNISEMGISYILNCTNLTRLMLEADNSLIDNFEGYICNALRKLVKLEEFLFFIQGGRIILSSV